MNKKIFVNMLNAGESFEDLFLVINPQLAQAKNGPFWRLQLRDVSGSVEAKIWHPLSQQISELKSGQLVLLAGRVVVYQGRNDIAVDSLRVLINEEIELLDLADFTMASSRPAEEMLIELEELLDKHLHYAPWRKFYKAVLKDDNIVKPLMVASAAKNMHHAYVGGLLEHTLAVCKLVLGLSDLYPQLDAQILLAGAFCHDLGKIWELSSGLATEYTTKGKLIGHISLVLEKLEPHLRKSGLEEELVDHFKHLLLSHHGQREFGSPCLPSTSEALVLHMADNTDAKLNQFASILDGLGEEGQEWSPYINLLERSIYKAVATPDGKITESKNKQKQEKQCSLLLKG